MGQEEGRSWEVAPPPDKRAARQRALGALVRERRARVTPRDVGLPTGDRRRTPGLRREEVAQLAGLNVSWYAWLEQGRDVRPSPSVLDAIARVLPLDAGEPRICSTSRASSCRARPEPPRSAPDRLRPRRRPHARGAGRTSMRRAGGLALLVAAALAGCGGDSGWTARDVPREYPTIQAAVDAANPGDLIRIAPGTYREQVVVPQSKHDLVLRGADRNRVVLGDDGDRYDGIVVHADGVAVENLTVRGFGSNGVLFTPARDAKPPLTGWRASYVTATNNGLHGIDALDARGGTIDHVWASGHGEAGLRVGRCRPCDLLA